MQIRKYRPSDCRELAELFYDTVHTVNAGDYTKEQLDAWTTGHVDLEAWDRSFREHHTLVALEDGAVIGFGDIDGSGYLDRLYVHRRHQGKGVATALCDRLEQVCAGVISTHASITAKPFFEKKRVSGHPGAAGGTAGRGAHQLRDGKTAVSQGEKREKNQKCRQRKFPPPAFLRKRLLLRLHRHHLRGGPPVYGGQWSAAQHGCQRAAPGPEQRETKQRGQHNCRKPPGGGRHHPVRFHRIPPECIEFRAFCD